jgi:hypothetical protein
MGKKFSPGIPSMEHNDIVADNDRDKVSLFLRKFISTFHHSHHESILPVCPRKTNSFLQNIAVDREAIIKKILSNLHISEGCGEDGINNRMLKLVASSIDDPLVSLFHRLRNSKIFPSCWKLGNIVPMFKNKGSTTAILNYRPVTLLNSLYTIFERVIYDSNHPMPCRTI